MISALFTSFYSWRLIFLTFFGAPRGDHHAHDHAHESPNTMLIPLGVLAAGSIFAGMIWYNPFFGDHTAMNAFFGIPAHEEEAGAVEPEAENVAPQAAEQAEATRTAEEPGEAAQRARSRAWAVLSSSARRTHVIDDAHHAPALVKASPFIAMLIGLGVAYLFYIVNPSLPVALARQQPVLYRFLLNKWYFDEIYEFVFVRPAKWLGTLLWKGGDGRTIDGFLNGVAMGFVPLVHPPRRPGAVRLPLPLRLRHGARVS